VNRRHLRLAAGTLALALPLAGAAACGADKKKTVKQEFASAEAHLKDSKAASFTLRLDDSKGALAGLAAKESDAPPKAVLDALFKGSVTYVVDPVGDATLKSVQSQGVSSEQLKKQLSSVNASFVIRDDKTEVAELRVVAGDLYLKVDLSEIGRLAKQVGVDDFDAQLDSAAAEMGPEFRTLVADARAGKYLKLPLANYLDQLQELAGAVPSPVPSTADDLGKLGSSLYGAIKPYVKVTDANDSSDERVLDVKVQVRPALKAALQVLKAEKSLPFLGPILGQADPAEIDRNVSNGEAHGTITLKKGHLTQFAVDLESLRLLDPAEKAGEDSLAGSRIVVDVDDDAEQVAVPTNVSSFDVGKLIDQFMQAFTGAAASSFQMSGSYSG
jgi:hypothetical protein